MGKIPLAYPPNSTSGVNRFTADWPFLRSVTFFFPYFDG
jgi:hypothetical protein